MRKNVLPCSDSSRYPSKPYSAPGGLFFGVLEGELIERGLIREGGFISISQ